MPQTHHLPRDLATRHSEPSTAYWSIGKPNRLVLFVHGFGGSAKKTWPDFPTLLPQCAGAQDTDFIMYQYDGRHTQANVSALDLFQFLDAFLKAPHQAVTASLGKNDRTRRFRYDRVLIVAHSLGSVVVRRALLMAHRTSTKARQTRSWLSTVRLVLFAPAHRGAYAAVLATELLTDLPWFLGRLLGRAERYRSPLLAELTPGSVVLEDLVKDTENALAQQPAAEYLVARRVLWAKRERIVINADFCWDPIAKPIEGDHFTVCKPRRSSDPALRAVVEEVTAP